MSKLRILHLEDNANDAFLIQLALERNDIDFERVLASRPEEFISAIKRQGFDVILLDDGMPGFNGRSALALARELQPKVPVIFVSGAAEEKQKAANFKAGAMDHILKNHLPRLVAVLRRIQEEKTREEALSTGGARPSPDTGAQHK